jgi:hypothetical protein
LKTGFYEKNPAQIPERKDLGKGLAIAMYLLGLDPV